MVAVVFGAVLQSDRQPDRDTIDGVPASQEKTTPASSPEPASPAEFSVDETTRTAAIDWSKAHIDDEPIRLSFLVVNNGSGPGRIVETMASCLCSKVTVPKGHIPPGQSRRIDVEVPLSKLEPNMGKSVSTWLTTAEATPKRLRSVAQFLPLEEP